ncbi:MAG: hypothetical protein H0U10_09440 [Chloroflexia bacterium]|nr:hypothetical protein [Chloroflexia bacterium]
MIVRHAKAVARRWAIEEATALPGFRGAFFHGSINDFPDDAPLPAASDIDVVVVFAEPGLEVNPPVKPRFGKRRYRGVLLDISSLPSDAIRSSDHILGQYHLAGSFRTPSVILDHSGWLTELQAAVAKKFAKRQWVDRRCEHARERILAHLRSADESASFPDQVTAWLFAAGVTTHVLLVAGLRNPTVRRRYVAARELLADYGRPEFHETLLELLGCARMSRARAEHHLAALTDAFDAAKTVVATPFFFASDISDLARPIAIDGSRELIAGGLHREAVFWLAATSSRCQKVLAHDAPAAMRDRFEPAYRELLGDLGIASTADLRRRREQVEAFLPHVWEVAEVIIAANPAIEK